MSITNLIAAETEHFGLALAILLFFTSCYLICKYLICRKVMQRIEDNDDYRMMNQGVGIAANVVFSYTMITAFLTMFTMYLSEVVYIFIHKKP